MREAAEPFVAGSVRRGSVSLGPPPQPTGDVQAHGPLAVFVSVVRLARAALLLTSAVLTRCVTQACLGQLWASPL